MQKHKLIAVAIAVAGTVSFSSCKKDAANTIADSKSHPVRMMGTGGTDEVGRAYPEYENYDMTDESVMMEKLLMINNCVNKPTEFHMPNMEIKEAVFFLETYFNAGVCQWQKYPVKSIEKHATYLITVPLANNYVTTTDAEGNVISTYLEGTSTDGTFLNGTVLQSAYRELLHTIVKNVFTEYAVNIGDVFVHSLTGTDVTLGLEISYGKPQKRGEDEVVYGEGPLPCPNGGGEFSKVLVTDMSLPHITYPPYTNPSLFNKHYCVSTFTNGEIKDEVMTIILNQKRTYHVPMEIRLHSETINQSGLNPVNFSYVRNNVSHSECLQFNRDFYDTDPISSNYGTNYRNAIWNYWDLDDIPLEAICMINHRYNPGNERDRVWHEWGVVKVCKYFLPPCTFAKVKYDGYCDVIP